MHIRPPFQISAPRLLLSLAVALALGGCATREDVKKEVDQYGDRVSGMETWFKAIDQGMGANARRIQGVEDRLGQVEKQGAGMNADLAASRAEMAATSRRLEQLAADLAAARVKLDSVSADVAANASQTSQRLSDLDLRLASNYRRQEGTQAGLALAEGRLTSLEGRSSPAVVPATDVTAMTAQAAVAVPVAAPAPAPTFASTSAPVAVAEPAVSSVPVAAAVTVPVAAPSAPPAEVQVASTLTPAVDQGAASARLASVEIALSSASRQSQEQVAALTEARQKITDLQAELAGLRTRLDANAAAIARIDGRLGDVDSNLAETHKRVETGEKALAESGLRLTMVQELVKGQSERLSRSEMENDKISATAQEALERARLAGKLAEGKLLFEATLTDEVTHFGFQDAKLNPEARKQLSEFAQRLKAENRGVFIEIQGHTDTLGSAEANLRLSRDRAQAVRDFLHEQEGIPLHRLAVAAYGESKPVADNKSKDGRARNRRVMLVVLN